MGRRMGETLNRAPGSDAFGWIYISVSVGIASYCGYWLALYYGATDPVTLVLASFVGGVLFLAPAGIAVAIALTVFGHAIGAAVSLVHGKG